MATRRRGMRAGFALLVFSGAVLVTVAARSIAPEGPQALSMDQYLRARWPSRPSWSPDGRYISFLWTDWKTQDLYVVAADGGAPIQLTKDDDFLGGSTWNSAGQFGEWSPDGRQILYSDRGKIISISIPDGRTKQLTNPSESENGARFSADGSRLAFSRGAGIYITSLKDGVTKPLGRDVRLGGGASWSPDGRWLSTSVGDPSTRITAAPGYSGSFITFMVPRGGQRDAGIVSTETGEVRILLQSPENESVIDWAPDSKSVLVQRTTIDVKERTMFLWSLEDGTSREVFKQRDQRYLGGDQMARFSPDGKWILLTSDQDGWNHLYTIPVTGGRPKQITSGAFEVSSVSLSEDGRTIYFSSTEAGSEQRHLYSVPATGGPRARLTQGPGVNATASLSPRGDRIAFIHSDPSHLPDLWVADAKPGGKPRQLTDSMTPELRAFTWQTPQIVTYPGDGGLPIKAQLFVPQPLQRGVRYPAIVHVHQAAAYQEVYLGPGPAKDNVGWYGWHQRLAGRGYVVLNVDFRGSTGYGRDFRSANYLDVGVGDAADVIKGVDYLKTLGYVDTSRLGVYGMSYGGHMVLTLLSKYPDVFKAGINIAGVFDFQVETGPWDTRNAWMHARLGSPEDNPQAYFNASAINFIDKVKAPIMTIQGTNDSNVTFLQSVKLIDELLKRGKTFEFEMYPGEVHFFGRRRSWVDAFGKMEAFFARYLKPDAAVPSTGP
jgi:dipeptidyl aminopeptidase/acylaminoacyl peptidase